MPFGPDAGDPLRREEMLRSAGLPTALDNLGGLPPEARQAAANFLLQQQAMSQKRQMDMLPDLGGPPGQPAGVQGGGGGGFGGIRQRGGGSGGAVGGMPRRGPFGF